MCKLNLLACGSVLMIGLLLFPAAAPAGLISYWAFDGNLEDSVGGNHGAAVRNAATGVDATRGNVLLLPQEGAAANNNDYVSLPAGTDTAYDMTTNDFTFAIWFKWTPGTTTVGTRGTLFTHSRNDGAEWNGVAGEVRIDNNSTATSDYACRSLLDGGPAANSAFAAGPPTLLNLNDGTWHHIAFTAQGIGQPTGLAKVYVDGTDVTTPIGTMNPSLANVISLSVLNAGPPESTAIFTVGSTRGVNNWFKGSLDDFAIWNAALPAPSIAGLANGAYTPLTAPVPEPGTFVLLGMGVLAWGWFRLRKK